MRGEPKMIILERSQVCLNYPEGFMQHLRAGKFPFSGLVLPPDKIIWAAILCRIGPATYNVSSPFSQVLHICLFVCSLLKEE